MRTVIKNNINEISVCVDKKRESGNFYTVIAITDEKMRREVARLVKGEGLFSKNRDFIGSFTYENSFCLVFTYRDEVRLSDREAFVANTFVKRKDIASSFVMACIETNCNGAVGELLIDDRNINVGTDNRIQFNYFLDFANYKESASDEGFFSMLSEYVYGVLSREYQLKYDNNVEAYPDEINAFHKKLYRSGFNSYNQILTFINLIPDKPTEKATGIKRIWRKITSAMQWAKANSTTLFLALIVVVTIIYLGYQIIARMSVSQDIDENTNYSGLYTIGDVYLGDEDL